MAQLSSGTLNRFIAIDFGTSTSVVCYKDYFSNGTSLTPEVQLPEIDTHGRQSKHIIPTLIYEKPDGQLVFGTEAENWNNRKPGGLIAEFKMDLVDPDEETRHRAEKYLDLFFQYLHKRYQESAQYNREYRVVMERTLVSYPSKWADPARKRTIEAAKKAGFQNVEGYDEPSAAMHFFLSAENQQTQNLIRKGVIKENVPLNVLLLDMGAGTTDLVLYRFTPGSDHQEVLLGWPQVNSKQTFGGREVDRILLDWLLERVHSSGPQKEILPRILKETRGWKEDVSRELLQEEETPNFPSYLRLFTDNLRLREKNIDPILTIEKDIPSISRDWIRKVLGDYLPTLPQLIKEMLAEAQKKGKIKGSGDIDLVVLTGGHSQWFFVREILEGKFTPSTQSNGAPLNLKKIIADPDRILATDKPQEAVARGLALFGRQVKITKLANNNCWFEFKVSISNPIVVQFVEAGEQLPLERVIYQRFPARYQPDYEVGVSWRPWFGSDLSSATPFDPGSANLEVQNVWDFLKVTVAQIIGLNDVEDTCALFLNVYVDEDEHLTAKGLIQGGEDFESAVYFAINRAPLTEDEKSTIEGQYREI